MATKTTGKRIVFAAEPEETAALDGMARRLRLSKIATLRFAVSLLGEMTDELTQGTKIIFKDRENNEREIVFPQLHIGGRLGKK
jgi:hypothetical protein